MKINNFIKKTKKYIIVSLKNILNQYEVYMKIKYYEKKM